MKKIYTTRTRSPSEELEAKFLGAWFIVSLGLDYNATYGRKKLSLLSSPKSPVSSNATVRVTVDGCACWKTPSQSAISKTAGLVVFCWISINWSASLGRVFPAR